MNETFDTGSYAARSFICAAAMTFVSFSVLPLSIFAVGKPLREASLVRVYSAEVSGEKNPRSSGGESSDLPVPRSAAESVSAPAFFDVSVDFSKVGISVPALGSGKAGFEISALVARNNGGSDFSEIKIFEISALDKIPRRLNNVNIKYPPALLRRGQEGEVRLNVILDEDGNLEVQSVESSTDKLFEQSAIDSATKLKFEPPRKNGAPVRAKFILPIPFKIVI